MPVVTKETLKQELDHFNDKQLKQIADFIAVIKFQSKLSQPTPDLSQFANLYQEYAEHLNDARCKQTQTLKFP
jgi:uncharacterized protein YozE (UPF0346 family)